MSAKDKTPGPKVPRSSTAPKQTFGVRFGPKRLRDEPPPQGTPSRPLPREMRRELSRRLGPLTRTERAIVMLGFGPGGSALAGLGLDEAEALLRRALEVSIRPGIETNEWLEAIQKLDGWVGNRELESRVKRLARQERNRSRKGKKHGEPKERPPQKWRGDTEPLRQALKRAISKAGGGPVTIPAEAARRLEDLLGRSYLGMTRPRKTPAHVGAETATAVAGAHAAVLHEFLSQKPHRELLWEGDDREITVEEAWRRLTFGAEVSPMEGADEFQLAMLRSTVHRGMPTEEVVRRLMAGLDFDFSTESILNTISFVPPEYDKKRADKKWKDYGGPDRRGVGGSKGAREVYRRLKKKRAQGEEP